MSWEQLKTLLWLRARLSGNQWRRQGALGQIIAAALAVLGALAAAGALAGGFLLGWLGLGEAPPRILNLVWLGISAAFLIFWMVGLLVELQRSETIDLQRLMHLPVRLEQIFALNYLASHFTLSLLLAVPAMVGAAVGLAVARGPAMLLLLPLSLSAVGMITAWTYCLRGWLAALMNNPRRRRSAIVVLTLGFVLVFQLPNLYFNVFGRLGDGPARAPRTQRTHGPREPSGEDLALFESLLAAERFVPPLWPAAGVESIAQGQLGQPLLETLGCLLLAAWGLLRAFRGTVRFYRGDGSASAARVETREPVAAPIRSRLIELELPWLPEQASAVATATWRSMLRAPEVKISLGASFVVTFLFGGMLLFRASHAIPELAKPFVVMGAVAFTHFTAIQFLANQFGLDREGFRTLVLSPAPREQIVLGKSVASLAVAATLSLVLLVASAAGLRLAPAAILAGLFQWLTAVFTVGLAGSALSVFFPLRVAPGSMKPTKTTGVNMLVVVAFQLLFPLAMTPAFAPLLVQLGLGALGYAHGQAVSLALSAALAALAALSYRKGIQGLGAALQRREAAVIAALTTEVE